MQDINQHDYHPSGGSAKKLELILRSAMLFVNFFLIITALYQIKPASRSLILDAIPADYLPYIWVISALTLFITIALYHQILKVYDRIHVVLGSALLFMIALIIFRSVLANPSLVNSVTFYIFVDIVGVVMVEQFWSLANSIFSTRDGKNWYGLVGTGGLLGGVTGSGLGAILISYTSAPSM